MTLKSDTLNREVAIGRLAAWLRVRDDQDPTWAHSAPVVYERGARAGLAHMWPLLEAARGALAWIEDGADSKSYRTTDDLRAAIALAEAPDHQS